MGRIKSKHQAAQVQVVNLGNRLGYRGRCRCGWESRFTRATKESAAADTTDHIDQKNRRH